MDDLVREFLFVELGAPSPASPGGGEDGQVEVEVLRAGTFVDRNGNEITIAAEDIEAYVANFEAGAAGQEVPIDVTHERQEAAGWVRGLRQEGERLLAMVEWNALGRQLVGEKVYRYLSATIERAKQVIKAISLTNFPAVKGLRPVELEEGVYGLEVRPGLVDRLVEAVRGVLSEMGDSSTALGMTARSLDSARDDGARSLDSARDDGGEGARDDGGEGARDDGDEDEHNQEVEMSDEERAALREEIRAEMEAEMEQERTTRAELEEEVREEIRVELEAELARRAELEAFAAEVCGGDGESGLSTPPEELVELMAGMDEEQVVQLQAVLRAKVVEFGERGSGRDGQGERQQMGPYLKRQVRTWLSSGGTLEEFFDVNAAELGEMGGWDVSEFEESE